MSYSHRFTQKHEAQLSVARRIQWGHVQWGKIKDMHTYFIAQSLISNWTGINPYRTAHSLLLSHIEACNPSFSVFLAPLKVYKKGKAVVFFSGNFTVTDFFYVFLVPCTSPASRFAWFGGAGDARWLGQVFSWWCSKPVLHVHVPRSSHTLTDLKSKLLW